MIFVAPPEGKAWTITAGSLMIARPIEDGWVNIWTDAPPYHPYRDPFTGGMIGCFTCVTLIQVRANQTFLPIIGGYSGTLRGMKPITVQYPNRLVIAINLGHGVLINPPLQTWVRFVVTEQDLPSRPQP